MIEINKYKINGYDCFEIFTNNGSFNISFCGNLDLYWSYKSNKDNFALHNSIDFFITKENYFLYSLFDKLYNDVKNYNIFTIDMFNSEDEWLERKKAFIESDRYNNKKLFKNNKIEFHSDDFDYDTGSSFIIEKLDDCYKLTFNRCLDDNLFGLASGFSVRIRNSGSRYGYFNMIFMRMYNELCMYDAYFHQIHIEEYMHRRNFKK